MLKMHKFNFKLEAVEENCVSLTGLSHTSMCFKAFRHPAYQSQASFRGTGRSLASMPSRHS